MIAAVEFELLGAVGQEFEVERLVAATLGLCGEGEHRVDHRLVDLGRREFALAFAAGLGGRTVFGDHEFVDHARAFVAGNGAVHLVHTGSELGGDDVQATRVEVLRLVVGAADGEVVLDRTVVEHVEHDFSGRRAELARDRELGQFHLEARALHGFDRRVIAQHGDEADDHHRGDQGDDDHRERDEHQRPAGGVVAAVEVRSTVRRWRGRGAFVEGGHRRVSLQEVIAAHSVT